MKMRKRRKLVKEPRYIYITYCPPIYLGDPDKINAWNVIFGSGPVKVRFPKL